VKSHHSRTFQMALRGFCIWTLHIFSKNRWDHW